MLSQIRQKKKKEAVRRLSQSRRSGAHSEESGLRRQLLGTGQSSVRATFGTTRAEGTTQPSPFFGGAIQPTAPVQASQLLFSTAATSAVNTSVFGNAGKKPFGAAAAGSGPDTKSGNVFGSGQKIGNFEFGSQAGFGQNENKPAGLFSSSFTSSAAVAEPNREPTSFPFASSTGLGQIASSGPTLTTVSGFPASQGVALFGSSSSTNQTTETTATAITSVPANQGLFPATSNPSNLFTSTFKPATSSSSVFGSSLPESQASIGFGKPVFGASNQTESGASSSFGFPVTPTAPQKKASFPTGGVFGQGSSGFPERSGKSTAVKRTFAKSQAFPGTSAKTERSPEDKTATNIDIKTLKGLLIKEIPELYNKNPLLKRFYSRFGEVTKVMCNPTKKSATVTFKTHEAAEAAKRKGKVLRPGNPPVAIFWKQDRKRSSSTSIDVTQLRVKKEPKKKEGGENEDLISLLSESDLQSLPLAVSAGDRFRTLDLIEKKIRQGMKKTTDIAKAQAVKGSCPDMCPEKERFMREDRRRLHPFEAVPGTGSMDENPQVNHTKAVKEYDRSAADKDEPLSHELRPTAVLNMTMDYLVTNIMDIGKGRWGEWFDFLWNRTRGIRKDITQQHLCDPDSVDLIEKTSRFHMFCAHYLCEEGLMSFDQRINTENLTKCLQTLKQFYSDLYSNQSITCPCEAEFRAYEILLNLNEGDTLREAMKYREEILKSPLVKLATSAFQALNSNNFVRFFKLVRSASYLCACILHRYFTQVRSKALRTMNYSLSTANKEMPFPLADLVQMLAFEDEQEAADFCSFYGLNVTETSVIFMRGTFLEPETKYPVRRALQLIESKRTCSIGQVVYNAPLPAAPSHQPVLSFDEVGQYRGTYHKQAALTIDKENQLPSSEGTTQAGPSFQATATAGPSFHGAAGSGALVTAGLPREVPIFGVPVFGSAGQSGAERASSPYKTAALAVKPAQEALQCTIEEVKNIAKGLFMEVMNEMFVEITGEFMDKVHVARAYSNELAKDIEEEEVTQFICEIAENAVLEGRRVELLAAQKAALNDRLTVDVNTDLVEEVLANETLRVAMETYSSAQEELHVREREHAAVEICQHLLASTVQSEIEGLACDAYRETKAQRKRELRELGQEFMLQRTARYFQRWLKSYHHLVHLKRLLREFPSNPPLTTNQEQLTELLGPREGTDEVHGPSIRIDGTEPNLGRSLEKRQAELRRLRAHVRRPLDIPDLLADATRHASRSVPRPSAVVDWKLVVSFPGPSSPLRHASIDVDGVELSEALIREKFKRGALPADNNIPVSLQRKVELLSLYRSETRDGYRDGMQYRICTLACDGVPSNTDVAELLTSRQFQGTSALLVVVRSRDLNNHTGLQELQMRVKRLVQSKPVIPAIPVLLLVWGDDVMRESVSDDNLLSAVGTKELTVQGLVSRTRILRIPALLGKHDLDHMLRGCVQWLAEPRSPLSVKQDSFKNFIEEGLQRYFFVPLYDDVSTRKKARLGEQCPEAIVELYNATIEHLAAVASSSHLANVSWPVAEFTAEHHTDLPPLDWNSEVCLAALRDNILNYCIPPPPPGVDDGTWASECAACVGYVKSLSICSCPLLRRVTWILDRKKRALEAVDFLSTLPRLTAAEVPWTQVLEACISYSMTSLHSDPVLAEVSVFFLPEELDRFEQPPVWRGCIDTTRQQRQEELHRSSLQTPSPVQTRHSRLHDSVMLIDQELNTICENEITSHQVSEACAPSPKSKGAGSVHELNERLGLALLEARQEIESFDSMLHNFVREEPGTSDVMAWQSKKRKAESCAMSEIPGMRSSRHRMETNTLSTSMVDNLSRLQESIRHERNSSEMIEERLRSFLDT